MKVLTHRWLNMAQSDFDTAWYLFSGARYPQAVYFLCQAIEKLLKASRIEKTNEAPEKIHRLENLTRHTGINFSDLQIKSLTTLSQHYSRVRYPDISQASYNTKKKVEPLMKKGKELYLWIRDQFKKQ